MIITSLSRKTNKSIEKFKKDVNGISNWLEMCKNISSA